MIPDLAFDIAARDGTGKAFASVNANASKTTKHLGGIGRAFSAIGANILATGMLAVTGAAAGAGAMVAKVANHADNLGKSAQSIGVPIDELARLTHSAEMSGSSFAGLSTGVRKFSQSIGDVLAGGASASAVAFKDLGIQVTDSSGKLKSTETLIGDVAEAFAGMENGARKTDTAMALFGKSGTELIPMLNTGRAGIKAMGDEAESLGLVISENTFKAAEAFNDNMARMGKAATGMGNTMVAGILPSLKMLTDRMVVASAEGGRFNGVATVLTGGFNLLARATIVVFDHLGDLYDLFRVFVAAKTILFITSAAGSFIQLAKSIRVAGLAMGLFSKVPRLGVTGLVVVAAIVAKATGYFDAFEQSLGNIYQSVMNFLPPELGQGIDSTIAGLKDLAFGTGDAAASFETYLGAADRAAASFEAVGSGAARAGAKVGAAGKTASDAWSGLRKATVAGRDAMTDAASVVGLSFEDMGRDIAGGIKSIFEDGRVSLDEFAEVGLSILSRWASNVLDQALQPVAKGFANLFSGSGSSGGGIWGMIGSLFGGGGSSIAMPRFAGLFADGGRIPNGQWGIAGEAGPEVITGPAHVTPMSKDQARAGRGGDVSPTYVDSRQYNFTGTSAELAEFRREVERDRASFEGKAIAAFNTGKRRRLIP